MKIARKPVALTVDEDLLYQAKVRSLQEGILLRDLVEQALKDFLAKPRS
jgi:post-segregation antitoxin (ccd killing protein)